MKPVTAQRSRREAGSWLSAVHGDQSGGGNAMSASQESMVSARRRSRFGKNHGEFGLRAQRPSRWCQLQAGGHGLCGSRDLRSGELWRNGEALVSQSSFRPYENPHHHHGFQN